MGRRILNDALRTIVNSERRGKATATLQPISTVIVSFLRIMKDRGRSSLFSCSRSWLFFQVLLHLRWIFWLVVFLLFIGNASKLASSLLIKYFAGYIKDFQVSDPHRVGRITVELQGRINDCKALTYRQDIKSKNIEDYRLRILPTRQVCFTSHICPVNSKYSS
ncbi:hypothetical protein BHE74_00030311 [Ensete ventricosum]|nr:hypothetical protein BHE74_00030311 [Ensete ventricosum]